MASQKTVGPGWYRTELLAANEASPGAEKIADALAFRVSFEQDELMVNVAR